MMSSCPDKTVLKTQVRRLMVDRWIRIPLTWLMFAAWIVSGEVLNRTLVMMATVIVLDLISYRIEKSLLRRQTSRRYRLLCLVQSLFTCSYTLMFVMILHEADSGRMLLAGALQTMLFVNCLIVRTDAALLAWSTVGPVVVGLVLTVGAAVAQLPPGIDAILIGVNIAVGIGYGMLGIYMMMKQRDALHQARRDAIEARRTKERFFAAIGHELRTPMNGILGIAQIAEQEARTPQDLERAAGLLSSATDLKQLLDDLLDHAKLAAGEFTISPEPCAPQQLLGGVSRLFEGRAEIDGITFEVTGAPDLPTTLLLDPVRVRQILSNLVNNALKYTPRGGRVTLATEMVDGQLVLSVIDTGPGIPEDRMDDLFVPYQQLGDDVARSGGGTGLGLTIARGLARAMGGDVTVKSPPSQGATFMVTLPARSPAPAPVAETDTSIGALAGRVVLVADDNRVNRMVARAILNRAGAEVCEAENGQAAIDCLDRFAPDILLLDIHMPYLNGPDTIAAIRAEPAYNDLKIVIASASGDTVLDGADGAVAKPLDSARLIGALNDVLAVPPAARVA